MTDHVAVLREMLTHTPLLLAREREAIDHAIALHTENKRLKAELSVRGDYVNETLQAKHAALVARLGELEKAWRERAAANYALNNIAATTIANTIVARVDDLARVVKEGGG